MGRQFLVDSAPSGTDKHEAAEETFKDTLAEHALPGLEFWDRQRLAPSNDPEPSAVAVKRSADDACSDDVLEPHTPYSNPIRGPG